MQQYLITTDEVSALSRGMSVHLDPDKIETYIRESENIYIKSALGDELFLDVKKNPEKYQLLLDGGTYEKTAFHLSDSFPGVCDLRVRLRTKVTAASGRSGYADAMARIRGTGRFSYEPPD